MATFPPDTPIDPDPAQLPHLLRLLNDPSPMVQRAVRNELLNFGSRLGDTIANQEFVLDRTQSARLHTILAEMASDTLRLNWQTWPGAGSGLSQLEAALTYLADFQDGPTGILAGEAPKSVASLLDDLATDFQRSPAPHDALALARHLFQRLHIRGASTDYYDPRNSNIRQVIHRKRGIPITMTALYMLVGNRLGISITGCNWPGHFLARIEYQGEIRLVDCYNEGQAIDVDGFLSTQGPSKIAARRLLEEEADVVVMVGRVVNNLVRAYQEAGHWSHSHLMLGLLRQVEAILHRRDD